MQVYKGSIHIHSTYSFDGTLSLERLRDSYAASGFDFLILSEHREDFSPVGYKELVSTCDALSRNDFLLVPGLEFHSEAIAVHGLREYPEDSLPMSNFLAHTRAKGTFNVLVHPSNLRNLPPKEILLQLHAVEVWNVRYDGSRFPSFRNLTIWRRLSRNFPLASIFGIDFHKKEGIGTTWVQVDLENLSSENLLDTLRKGHFSLFSGSGEWHMESLHGKQLFEICVYHYMRWFAIRFYKKMRHLLPDTLIHFLKKLVNG